MARPAARPGRAPMSSAVMGLAEVLQHLPRLLRLRAAAAHALAAASARMSSSASTHRSSTSASRAHLKRAGIRHRAVRESAGVGVAPGARAHHRRGAAIWCCACCPSRPSSLPRHGVRAEFVGHPLADQIPLRADRAAARAAARTRGERAADRAAARQPPGRSERLAAPFVEAAARIAQRAARLRLHRAHGLGGRA